MCNYPMGKGLIIGLNQMTISLKNCFNFLPIISELPLKLIRDNKPGGLEAKFFMYKCIIFSIISFFTGIFIDNAEEGL